MFKKFEMTYTMGYEDCMLQAFSKGDPKDREFWLGMGRVTYGHMTEEERRVLDMADDERKAFVESKTDDELRLMFNGGWADYELPRKELMRRRIVAREAGYA
jgi:hypothetical protein